MINKDRLAVVIGKNGLTKKQLQYLTHCIIDIDSTTGDYTIHPQEEDMEQDSDLIKIYENMDIPIESQQMFKDSPNFGVWTAKKIIEAINIGFKPEKAFQLINQEFIFEMISLETAVGSSQKNIKRIKGRIIGENGSMRQAIEKYSTACSNSK